MFGEGPFFSLRAHFMSVFTANANNLFQNFRTLPPPPRVKKKMVFPLTGHSTVFLCAPDKIIKNIFVLDCFDEQAKRVLAKVAL